MSNLAGIVFPHQLFREHPALISSGIVYVDPVVAWQQERNQEHAKVKWQFTTADARIKLHHLYPQF